MGKGDRCLATRSFSAQMRHATELLPTIDALCRDHGIMPGDLQRVIVCAGPGSFTGLRIGITCARMLALATGLVTVGLPTLDVIAQNALDLPDPPDRVVVMLDAKRKRVFAASFVRQGDQYVARMPAIEVEPLAYCANQPKPVAVMGDVLKSYGQALTDEGVVLLPEELGRQSAEALFRLACRRAAEGTLEPQSQLIPTYIRPPEAEEVWNRRHSQRDPR